MREALERRTAAWRAMSNASDSPPEIRTMYEVCAAEIESILRGQSDGEYPHLSGWEYDEEAAQAWIYRGMPHPTTEKGEGDPAAIADEHHRAHCEDGDWCDPQDD